MLSLAPNVGGSTGAPMDLTWSGPVDGDAWTPTLTTFERNDCVLTR